MPLNEPGSLQSLAPPNTVIHNDTRRAPPGSLNSHSPANTTARTGHKHNPAAEAAATSHDAGSPWRHSFQARGCATENPGGLQGYSGAA